MWTDLQDRPYTVMDISSVAEVETLETYQDAISRFEDEQWTFIPLPEDNQYYDRRAGELKKLDESQFVPPDHHLINGLEKLVEQPFLLVEAENGYEIVNLSDVNRRKVKEFIYPVLSELEDQLSNRIADVYPDPEKLLGQVGEVTVGIWYLARRDDVDLHIAEFLTLGNMIRIIKGNGKLEKACGFQDSDEVQKLGGIEKLRNRVMHGNRALVHDRGMLEKHLERIERAESIVTRLI